MKKVNNTQGVQGKVQKFEAVMASQNAIDRFDDDNFYPFDGEMDGELTDIEFSNGSGKLKDFFGGLKGKVGKFNEGTSDRLSNREARVGARVARRTSRKESRERRRELRNPAQVALVSEQPAEVKLAIKDIAIKNEAVKKPVIKTSEGVANKTEEKIATVVVEEAVKLAKERVEDPSKEATELEVNTKTGNVTEKTGLAAMSTGVKVAIFGGSALALGLITYLIVKK